MNPFDTKPGLFDIWWRVAGTSVRIKPSYWIFTGIFGYCLGQTDLWRLIAWVIACAIATLVHEYPQVIVGRIFGYPGAVILMGMGGGIVAEYERAARWQRIVISTTSILASVLFFWALCSLTPKFIANLNAFGKWWEFAFWLFSDLLFKAVFDIVFGVLPILPYAGGKIATELLGYAFGKRNYILGLLLSLATTAGVIGYSIYKYRNPDVPYFGELLRKVFPSAITPPGGGEIPAWLMAIMFGFTAFFLVKKIVSYWRGNSGTGEPRRVSDPVDAEYEPGR